MKTVFRSLAFGILAAIGIGASSVLLSLILILRGFTLTTDFPKDCALVFGAAILRNNSPGPALERRVHGAIELWRDDNVRLLIFSGGKGDAFHLSEAAVMRNQALDRGVPAEAILLEETSRSTKENIEKSAELVRSNCSSVVAVSDQYHLARIRLLAKRAGLADLEYYGISERPLKGEWLSVFRELAAYTYYAFGLDAIFALETYDDVPGQQTSL